ncbi:MAG: hypothetical protein RL000_1383 [Bacteroidota bacterium]
MIIYNVTTMVSHAVHDQWLLWMKEEHLPEIMATGLFERNQFMRLLDIEEEQGITYAVQFFASTKENYDTYISNHAPALRLKGTEKWGDQVVGFRTLMKIVH